MNDHAVRAKHQRQRHNRVQRTAVSGEKFLQRYARKKPHQVRDKNRAHGYNGKAGISSTGICSPLHPQNDFPGRDAFLPARITSGFSVPSSLSRVNYSMNGQVFSTIYRACKNYPVHAKIEKGLYRCACSHTVTVLFCCCFMVETE